MTQKNLSTTQIRVIPICAKGVIYSAAGQPAEIRRPPFSHFWTSNKASICPSVNLNHHRAGDRIEDAAFGDFLRDMGQSHISPVTLILIWILTYRSNHSININISTQRITQYEQEAAQHYWLEEGSPTQRNRRSEPLRLRGEKSLVLPPFNLFCFTLTTVAVNHRENHRAAQVRSSKASGPKGLASSHSVFSIIRPLPVRFALPAWVIYSLSANPGSELSPACPPLFSFASESPSFSVALRLLACLQLLSSSAPFHKSHLSLFSITASLIAGLSPTSVSSFRIHNQVFNVQVSPAYLGPVFRYLFNNNNNSSMARSEDCLHCADLQAELEEIRTQQSMLDRKQNLLEARIEDHDRRLDEQSRRLFE